MSLKVVDSEQNGMKVIDVSGNFPDTLQCLCMNCQFIKRDEMNECRGPKNAISD